ncbi:hypothetical protein [Arthrobacter sp. StoSoilB22]|uniref:hypothetical protein n=1 Tax=Arthrobacter sp. StoSoilB22 TaxID=2830996 RepID=UPI001CC56E31|nr:hypothetical protein [Arthrobacter sp. StoSoilB22]BCW61858.1 hypothetical protein StoSoilB22_08310 [Arthrobacter sp. StoSoilB22]
MNRYVVDGLVADLRAGKTIGLMGITRVSTRNTFNAVADAVPDYELSRVYRANGYEQIDHAAGGSLRLLATSTSKIPSLGLTTLVIADWHHLDVALVENLVDTIRRVGGIDVVRL